MKFPSLKSLAEGAAHTIKCYPFEVLFALAGTIAATAEVELRHLNREHESWCIRIIMIANLGLLLSLSATLYTQSRNIAMGKRRLIKYVAAIFAASLIFIIDPSAREADYIRFFLMSLAFHLLVAFAAFTGKGQLQGFWQFNKALFSRILTAVLYGLVLFLGLAAAIGATNFLFNFNFEWDTYAILWVWIVGMFTTIFFLAGVPVETHLLDEDQSYPKGLKIFTQYVLIPLSTVYVIILLAYEVKILVEWNLPKGLVSNLVLGYAVFGILSLLLVYPIREHDENKWLKTYARSFYFLLIPLLGLLFVAVGTRVFKYGITEWRYFLIVLACWLLFISIYFLLFKKQNIKLIPVSLCVLTILAIYGPQSAFSVSMYSQRRIIVQFFKNNNAFKNGKLIPVDSTKISNKVGSHAVANLEYFISHYDLAPLQPYFKKDLAAVADSLGKLKSKGDYGLVGRYELRNEKLEWAKNYLGLHKFKSYYFAGMDTVDNHPEYQINTQGITRDVKGYDLIFNTGYQADTVNDKFNDLTIQHVTLANKVCRLTINNETLKFNTQDLAKKLIVDTKQLEKYRQHADEDEYQRIYSVPVDLISVTQETPNYKVRFIVDNMHFRLFKNDKPEVTSLTFMYLIKQK
ncbi:DUF4153 domain-containing protein [Mucilaginibacter sabulilitoris]|uniref:DUF4153 domain-containing protein n=1 Tax=Mucilaginibacter sabulilitoris TaxID=1173583 RepID=A0ABZ0TS75_9SPHI|nr:DUF4153 domain-containing protein [Mucilaginibacter sabulilitoris]WPU94624.1 DUF4153 domain-containing protein [Mucilaginibacter sabulilitoris]